MAIRDVYSTGIDGPPPGYPPELRKQKEILFYEEERAFLEKRARAIIARRPELEAKLRGLLS
jgi:hypothetical protein